MSNNQQPEQFARANAVEIERRREERYQKAQLPDPYKQTRFANQSRTNIEEINFEELSEMEEGSIQSEASLYQTNVVDCDIDEYLLDEQLTSGHRNIQTSKTRKGETKFRNEPSEAEILLSAHVVDRRNAKRPRLYDDILNEEDIDPISRKPSNSDAFHYEKTTSRIKKRQVEPLINARINEGPFNYMGILEKAKVEMSVKDIAQMSPAARKHWKHGISRVNNKKSKKKSVPRPEPEPEEILEVTANHARATHVAKNENITLEPKFTYKSFRVEARIEIEQDNKIKHVLLHIDHTHVDQGADLNLISSALVGKLKLRRMGLPKPIQFGTAEGRMTKATQYVKLKIAVAGIWRETEALILPPTAGNPTSLI
ncbi:hypothetical protein K3495_g15760, partial [Podosphaera aphanis]